MLNKDRLRCYPIFDNLGETELQAISECVHKHRYGKNSYIFHPGSSATNLYLVESGLVRLMFYNHDGEEFLLNLAGPLTVIGQPLMLENQTRLMGAVAHLPSVILSLSYEDLFHFMESSRQLTINLYTELGSSMRKLLLHYQSFFTVGLDSRVATLLLHLQEGKGNEFQLPISQARLASWLGVSRGRLNRIMIQFKKNDMISLEGTRVCILDSQGLKRISEGDSFK